MKKLLFITDNKIKGVGGGCLGSRKYFDALNTYCIKKRYDFKVVSLDNDMDERLPIEIYKTRSIDILSRLYGHSTYLYYILKGQFERIIEYEPDYIFLGRTRLGFIAKYIKKILPKTKIVVFVDNIEFDYVDSYFSRKNGILGSIVKCLERYVVKRDESDSVKFCDKLIYLTNRDCLRVQHLYKYYDQDPKILPVCLPDEQKLTINSSKKNVYFIGSLNYGANIDAVEHFINHIWTPFFGNHKDINLIIAGSNPVKEIKEIVNKSDNILLIENFDDVRNFISRKSLMIAPIAKGAGMKVKVADTLSMGLMIVASDEALIGYEEGISCDQLHGIIRANTIDEYKKAITEYLESSDEVLENIEHQNIEIFRRFYSFERSRQTIAQIIDYLN